jgi:hypothetical protein
VAQLGEQLAIAEQLNRQQKLAIEMMVQARE